ncbi:2-hydroxyisoflavanone dehydratase [Melia azedarach]|uniref:2-hydroxyisoflavanone dehydratase n=1 Tax=Melia azedarach TaxID=155640 RepID=A0ACC1YFX7_MELAZ|nr:2-hydroxyisoflavanone dehydratase [Melia azedarach]
MASTTKEVVKEIAPLVRVYKDGSVERLDLGSHYVPPSPDRPDSTTSVSSKDIIISNNPDISARLYLPNLTQPHQKLPILVYFHGGAFCIGSAFSFFDHRYLNNLVSQAQVVAVSVEYRLAPEHPLPAAYEDCWAALQWVASHYEGDSNNKEPWLSNYGDFNRLYLGGDSAGGNIGHNIAMRAGEEGLSWGVKICGAILVQPYFWGSIPIGSESGEKNFQYLIWEFSYPSAPGGIDNVLVNPVGPGKPSLAKLGCCRLLEK